jgi:hypothetical protein
VKHPRKRDVVDILGVTGEEPGVLFAGYPLPNETSA